MVRPRGMFTSFYQAQKIAVTLLYKFKTVDLSCFYTEEKILSKWQKTAIWIPKMVKNGNGFSNDLGNGFTQFLKHRTSAVFTLYYHFFTIFQPNGFQFSNNVCLNISQQSGFVK